VGAIAGAALSPAARVASAAAEPAHAAPPPGFIERVLPNGLEVSILPDSTLPVVATRLWYHVGAANEEPRTRGFAHLFEHLMFGGTATRDKRAYWEHHHRLGGNENAHTSFDETVYESNIPPAGFPDVLAMEADRMVNLRLDQENLDNEKRIVTEELRLRTENSPYNRMIHEAFKQVFGAHPYAVMATGTREDIAAATLDRTRDFYARYYKPRNAHLVVVGPVDGPATIAEIEQHFGPLPAAGETPPDVPSLEGWKFPPRVHLKEDLPPAEIAVLVYPLPPPAARDAAAVTIMGELLAGGQVDAFEQELVTRRHKALAASTSQLMMRRGGILFFLSAVLPYRRESGQFRTMDQAVRHLARKEWLTDEALAAVKRRVLRRIENQRYLAGEMAAAIGEERWHGGDVQRFFDRVERYESVTRAEVAAAFDRYIGGATPVRVYIQPRRVPLFVRLFGWALPLVMR
jgi:predicted Zn-dependent peptidase